MPAGTDPRVTGVPERFSACRMSLAVLDDVPWTRSAAHLLVALKSEVQKTVPLRYGQSEDELWRYAATVANEWSVALRARVRMDRLRNLTDGYFNRDDGTYADAVSAPLLILLVIPGAHTDFSAQVLREVISERLRLGGRTVFLSTVAVPDLPGSRVPQSLCDLLSDPNVVSATSIRDPSK